MTPNVNPAPTKRRRARTGAIVMLLAFAGSVFYWTGVDQAVVSALLPAGRFDVRLLGVKIKYDVPHR